MTGISVAEAKTRLTGLIHRGLWDTIADWRTQTAFDWPDLTAEEVDGWRDPSPGRVFDWTD
ncbi:hypothetical protein [uncultured Thiodictyon sp.]|jgi:hypothetical protein|uniref:hypothetical protein n=1 Tax=uncultured Thiodictyon sp. TaxID=1846217 RepID=UPI0025DDA3D4|nr:hypothetical protein [uncultured Thiodictyon sp.]